MSRHVDGDVRRVHERRHVRDGHRARPTVDDLDVRDDEPRGDLEAHARHGFRDGDHALLDEHGGDPDGAMAAHREAAGHLDEQDGDVRVGAGRWLQDRTGHRRMPARLEHEERAEVVVLGLERGATGEHVGSGQRHEAAGHHARRHPSVWESTTWIVSPGLMRRWRRVRSGADG